MVLVWNSSWAIKYAICVAYVSSNFHRTAILQTEGNSRILCKIPDIFDDFTVEVIYMLIVQPSPEYISCQGRRGTHFSWPRLQVTNKSSQTNGAKLFSELDTEAWSDWKASSRLQLPIGSVVNPKSPKCIFKGKRCNLTPRIWLGPAILNVSTVSSLMSTAPFGTYTIVWKIKVKKS